MFKRLRERIEETATKFPVGQNSTGKQPGDADNKTTAASSTEDLITLSDSSAVVVPHTSPQQFSIGEDEDGSMSEQGTPQKKKSESANGQVAEKSFYTPGPRDHPQGTGSDLSFCQEYRPTKSSYIPQSDIESEREDPPTLNLEGISKEQLLTIIDVLKAKSYKYRNKYTEVVKNFKEIRDEKLKIEHTLIENQDKGARRMAELREQCQLEQKAKAHLEATLRLLLEEKDSRISVLETQIKLLKENGKPDTFKSLPEAGDAPNSDASVGDTQSDNSTTMSQDGSILQEKLDRLEHQFNQAKKTITSQTDQLSLLRKQNEALSKELEEKVNNLNKLEDEQSKLKLQHEDILKTMQIRLEELENQQEESAMSMAETKRNMHEELELKEKQLTKAEEEAKQFQTVCESEKAKVIEMQKEHEEKINELQRQLETTEKMLEEEKQNLMQELTRGKSAAITLVQQDCAKRILAVEEECKTKLLALQLEKENCVQSQVGDANQNMIVLEEKLKQSEQNIDKLNVLVSQLEEENSILKISLERLEQDYAIKTSKLDSLQVEYLELKEQNETMALRFEDRLKVALDTERQSVVRAEAELQSLRDFLSDQLNEKQNVIDEMVHNKNALYIRIDALEKRECELKIEADKFADEVTNLNSKLCDLSTEYEAVCKSDSCKSEEIKLLEERLSKIQMDHAAAIKEFNEYEQHVEQLKAENRQLMLKMEECKTNVEENKNKLLTSENDIQSMKNVLAELIWRFSALYKCFYQKQKAFINLKNVCASMQQREPDFYNQTLKSEMAKHNNSCNELVDKVINLSKIFETAHMNYSLPCMNVIENSVLEDKNCNLWFMETNNLLEDFKTENGDCWQEDVHGRCSKVVDEHSSEGRYDITCSDVNELQKMVQELLSENQKAKQELQELKELSEMQNIDFAKNITQLHESLNQLQDERNNLSLVLQSIETEPTGVNFELKKPVELVENKDTVLIDSIGNECRIDIKELNNKVKSEILALATQTELINQELRTLREQFNSSQATYSEKVMQLNTRLMRRTEQLFKLKEDLDVSMQNSEDLKTLLESLKSELEEKDDLLKVSEKSKCDLENKCKALKEKFTKKELTLKQAHNSQLSDIKNQTKATIDKLNEEIKKANSVLMENKAKHGLELENVKGHYECETNENVCQVVHCQKVLEEIFNFSACFETKCFNNLDKIELYGSRITHLNNNLNQIAVKLQEKEEINNSQQSEILDLKNKIQYLLKENENVSFLKNDLTKILSLLEKSNAELNDVKKQKEMFQSSFLIIKENISAMMKEFSNCSENEVLEFSSKDCITLFEETDIHLQTNSSVEECLFNLIQLKCKNQNLQEKSDSLVKEVEGLNVAIEEEKINVLEKTKTLDEWKTLYTNILHNINTFSCRSFDNLSLIASKINQNEFKLESFESQFSKLSSNLKTHKAHLSEHQKALEKCKKENKSLLKKLQIQEAAMKEKEKEYSHVKVEKEKLATYLKNSKSELETTKTMYDKSNSSLGEAILELENLKSQNSIFKDLQNTCKCLEEELECAKSNLEDNKKVTAEAYQIILCNSNEVVSQSYKNMDEITNNVNGHFSKLKSFEAQFSKLSSTFKSQKIKINVLKKEIKELKDKNDGLMEELASQNDARCELKILGQRINEITAREEALKSDMENQLDKTKSELKAVIAENKLLSDKLIDIQDQLAEAFVNLKVSENKCKHENEKNIVAERSAQEWEERCITVSDSCKALSDAAKVTEDKLKIAMQEIETKTAQMDSMISKKEFDKCRNIHADRLKQIENLQENIKVLSSKVLEKEALINDIQTEKVNIEAHHDESLNCLKDKLKNVEKNYLIQLDEMKSQISLLEKEKCSLVTEKDDLLKVKEKVSNFKTEEKVMKSELRSKEDELQKLQTSNKDQVSKIHSMQETMKDKENMILKLKANIESITKENLERSEELKRKIKSLEEEREKLMIQAQERVSQTEAKCRDDIKALQLKNNKLLVENNEIEKLNTKISQLNKQLIETRHLVESNEAAARKEISGLRDQLAIAEERLSDSEKTKQVIEADLSGKLKLLQEENSSLLGKSDNVESLKSEKEELNEKLKQAEQQVTSIKELQNERDTLRVQNAAILNEIELLKSSEDLLQKELKTLQENENDLRLQLEKLRGNNENLELELSNIKTMLEKEKDTFKLENGKLLKQIGILEKFHSADPESGSMKEYIAVVRGECETAMKAKEEEMETKLKHLVRDFCIQMDVKDNDCDKMVSELLEKNQDLEEKLLNKHRKEISELRQSLFEKECAFDEVRDNYEEAMQEKDKKLKELQSTLKKISESSQSDIPPIGIEGSDWDETWAVPDESVENTGPEPSKEQCMEHFLQIESLQDELSKCNSEIKELKVLLRLSPPESMVHNNNRRDSLQSIPEPTEFEYLKNIIYEYMMGKEPITLAKVIAAVLRFSESQTQQVIRREESRHPTR